MFRCRLNNLFKYCLVGDPYKKLTPVKGSIILMKQKRYVSIRIRPEEERSNTEFLKWVLLAIPVTSFGLGCWQVQRRQWKLDLIKNLNERSSASPVVLPENLQELNNMEYRSVIVRGHFLHDREFIIGPRTRIDQQENKSGSNYFQDSSSKIGFLIITPFKLSDREETILINRGWIHNKLKKQSTRPESLVPGEVELVGVVRLQEKRGQFMPKNNPAKQQWMYRDLKEMGETYGTDPIWLDAKGSTNCPKGIPVPNQTRVTLRNEHATYVITWFGLCAATSWMWIRLFIHKLPLP